MHSNIFSGLRMLVICLLCTLSSFAQELDETLPPLVNEEYTLEGEATEEIDAALWTPTFLSGSSSAMTDALRQGHVYSAFDFAMLSASDEAFQFDGDSVLTPRFQLGWESESGFGVRGSYWEFENELFDESPDWGTILTDTDSNEVFDFIHVNSNTVVNFPIEQHAYTFDLAGRHMESLDLNFYQRFDAGDSQFTLGVGLRSVRAQLQQYLVDRVINSSLLPTVTFAENGLFAGRQFDQQQSIEGIGPSLFVEFQRPVFERVSTQLAFFTAAQTSFVPTDFEVRNSTATPISLDDELWINEANAGVELSRRYRQLVLRVRSQLETQLWNSSVTDNQAFTGASLSFGVDW
jgi:hypothetical protein